MAEAAQTLVPGRECGECTACCTHFLIRTPGFTKLQGITCEHCENGCRIYEGRPQVCRDFFCGWRTMPDLPDSWRPDRIGVIVRPFDAPSGVREYHFLLFGAKFALLDKGFAAAVAKLVGENRQTYLVLPGKPDEASTKVFLNAGLRAAVAAKDLTAVSKGLTLAYESGLRHPRQKLNLGAPGTSAFQ
jgi:hypothetical protein